MGAADLIALAKLFGPIGLFIGYLIWREIRCEKATAERERLNRDAEKERAHEDRALARERIDTDRAVASAMSNLAAKIDGIRL